MNTTCSACQAEVVLLSKLAAMHEGKLDVYLIAVDMRGKNLVKSYHENYKYNVEYLLDPRFSLPPHYGFGYTPALVLLDKTGKILYKKGGYYPADADALIKSIEDLL
jgi:thiol-disulfide isomerase/thioredoxin